jgi:hypothetical protein
MSTIEHLVIKHREGRISGNGPCSLEHTIVHRLCISARMTKVPERNHCTSFQSSFSEIHKIKIVVHALVDGDHTYSSSVVLSLAKTATAMT